MQISWLLPRQLLHLRSSIWRRFWAGRAVWNVSSWNSVNLNAMTNLLTVYSRKPRSSLVYNWNQQPLVYVIFRYTSFQLSCFITARLLYSFCEFIHYVFQNLYSSFLFLRPYTISSFPRRSSRPPRMRQLRLRGRHQPAYYIHQDIFSFLVLGSLCLPPGFAGSMGWWSVLQECLEGGGGDAQGRVQRVCSPRTPLHVVDATILMSFIGNGTSVCQRGVPSHSVRGQLG